jgi:hypothetical protein
MSYLENRVTTAFYGSLPEDSPLLVNVPTTPGHPQQRMHLLAAQKMAAMDQAILSDLGIVAQTASGWRPHRWASLAQYHQTLIDTYKARLQAKLGRVPTDAEVLAFGRIYLAFDSPHETGLARDFGCGGLIPVSATIEEQKKTPLFKWLVDNAYKHDVTPYFPEPWHWECRILSLDAYKKGIPDTLAQANEETVTTCSDPNDVCEAPLDNFMVVTS